MLDRSRDSDRPGALPPIAIVGPTASGKTAVSLALAHALGGEIVNVDSMQLYRGMDIGTAKLPEAEREGIPHHQIDTLDVTQPASVAAYREAAIADIRAIQARGNRPVIVGGSMMYVQALVDDWDFPPTDPEVRRRWEARLAEIGVEALHDELAARDPAAAEIIERKDPRRTVRALEVLELTGQPYAASLPPKDMPTRFGTRIIGLSAPAEWLSPRIEQRVHLMFDAGLLAEVEALTDVGLVRHSTAGQAIGYAQVLDYRAGELSYDEAVERTITGTRRYARRQRAWFRRDPRIRWVDAAADSVVADVLAVAQEH